ncbi:MAG: GDYXXLXY domain-containing protein [Pseudomonadota bacterium]
MNRLLIAGAVIAALVQTAWLGSIVYQRAQFLANGQEVRIKVEGYDPRDLFRGHYVRLRPTIREVPRSSVTIDGDFSYNDTVYVLVKPDEDGFAVPVTVYSELPENPDGPIIRAVARSEPKGSTESLYLNFPFTRYYAEKRRALALEDFNRDGQLGLILAVSETGTGMIKGLTIDGEVFYEEGLY